MAKVTMNFQISGSRDGVDWPAPGDTIDVPPDEADSLVAQGLAEPVKPAAKAKSRPPGLADD